MKIIVRQEKERVLLITDSGMFIDMPWQKALEVARALYHQARLAEEFEKHEQIIFDQALLLRSGVKLGLSSTPEIKKEAIKEAQWNRDLRRYIPDKGISIPSSESFGIPSVKEKK
jgi:uncharacterized protein with NRDE domain